jgi:hypothetical protein
LGDDFENNKIRIFHVFTLVITNSNTLTVLFIPANNLDAENIIQSSKSKIQR